MNIIKGNIIHADADYIIQQCNCLTVRSHGLAKTLEDAFPHANLYGRRRSVGNRNLAIPEDRSLPGTGTILAGAPNIVCLFGQWRPGRTNASYWNSYPESSPIETEEQRIIWFKSALFAFGDYLIQNNLINAKMAMPYNIGCGLAGGDWTIYSKIIGQFIDTYKVNLTIYQL